MSFKDPEGGGKSGVDYAENWASALATIGFKTNTGIFIASCTDDASCKVCRTSNTVLVPTSSDHFACGQYYAYATINKDSCKAGEGGVAKATALAYARPLVNDEVLPGYREACMDHAFHLVYAAP